MIVDGPIPERVLTLVAAATIFAVMFALGLGIVRGQFRGYLAEPGVAKDSRTETFAALRLDIDSWRWQGVPIYIRAGKSLPVTCTEIVVRLRRAPRIFPTGIEMSQGAPNYLRFRLGSEAEIALGARWARASSRRASRWSARRSNSMPAIPRPTR